MTTRILVALAILQIPGLSTAEDLPPDAYLAMAVGGGVSMAPAAEAQGSITPLVGVGSFIGHDLAIEVDLGPTFVATGFGGLGAVPGIVWTFHRGFYAAGRFLLAMSPNPGIAVSPGVGAILPLRSRFSPMLEVSALAGLAGDVPDYGVMVTAGTLYLF